MSNDRPKTLRELQLSGVDPVKVLGEYIEHGGRARAALDLSESLVEAGNFRAALQAVKEGQERFSLAFDALNTMVSLDEMRSMRQVSQVTDGSGFGSKIRALMAAGSKALLGAGAEPASEELTGVRPGSSGGPAEEAKTEAIECDTHAACYIVNGEHIRARIPPELRNDEPADEEDDGPEAV